MKTTSPTYKRLLLLISILLCSSILHARNDRDTLGIGTRLLFSENLGQWEQHILFRSQMKAATLFVERDCFTFVVQHPDNPNLHHPHTKNPNGKNDSYRTHAYRIRFDASNAASVVGAEREAGHENYFIGNDPSRWRSNVGVYQSVVYNNLYDGIDMKVYSASNAMKYDFIVQPGAKPSDIVLSYEGADGVSIKNGNIIVHTSVVDIVELRPYAYQFVDGRQTEVAVRYTLKDNRVAFSVGKYDDSLPLIIDPYLYFSTYTGSTSDNWGTTGCYDSHKNTYTSGVVFGSGYPVSTGAYDGSYNGNCDIGIFKFDTSGSQRLYATYLGGSNADMPHSMYVNSLDELVIFGTTGSPNFPVTPRAYDTSFNGGTSLQYEGSTTINFPNGSDIFICRFNSSGSQLMASTFVGGSGNDGLNYRNSFSYNTIMIGNDSLYFNYGDGARGELITDDLNNIYVGSTTTSSNFPVTDGCIQPYNRGGQDGVVFKIDYNLSNMIWSTYLGGSKDDAIYSIDCDPDYNVVVTGGTNSINFPVTQGAYNTYYRGGSADAFVAKISYYGKTLMASSYFGSNAYDQSYFVRCSKQGDIFLFGQTKAPASTLIHNANYNTPNSGQFLARFLPDLSNISWSTVFGDGSGEPNISPTAFAVDICNRVYLSGWGRIFLGQSFNNTYYPWNTHGTSSLTVTSDAYQSTTDGQDFYIMSLDMAANDIVYATFFGEQHTSSSGYYSGGDHVDGGTSRFDRLGTLYQSVCASCSGGDNFPITSGAYGQHNNSNNCNNAIFRINLTDDFPVAEFTYTTDNSCAPTNVAFRNTGRGTSYLWDFGDGYSSTDVNPSHTYSAAGTYTVSLVAYMPDGCRTSDTISKTLTIINSDDTLHLDTLRTCPGTPVQMGMRPEVGYSYLWTIGAVSDSNISNPVADQPGLYVLYISNGNCTQRVEQHIVAGETEAHIVGDSVFCSVPSSLSYVAAGNGITYIWSSNRQFSDTLNSDLSSGVVTFTPVDGQWLYAYAVDELGCYKTDSIQIDFYNIIDNIEIIPPLCPGGDGQMRVTLSDEAQAPFSWKKSENSPWTPMSQPSAPYDSIVASPLIFQWTTTVRDNNGCTVTFSWSVPDTPPPHIDASVQHIACLESCSGTIDITVTGNSSYSLLWLDDSSTTASRDSLCPGLYYLQVTDSNGCIFFDTIEILENYDMSIIISHTANTCPNSCSGTAMATAYGGTPPYSYLWSSGEQNATAVRLCDGMALVVATDANGCVVSDSVTINSQQSFDSITVWADSYDLFNGQSTVLHVSEITNATYWWSPSDKVGSPSAPSTTATPDDSMFFYVTVTDSLGCTYTDSLKVNCTSVTCGKPNIYIPNAFTPNGDGKNDELCFSGEWVSDFHIAIFTRWGEKVFESDDINKCWDGRFRDNWCMPGVYVYHCRITCADGQVSQLKGDVTLIR